ncbi:MAG: hypothetical protein OHK0013_06390 [Sandaracinaceae bacterium]
MTAVVTRRRGIEDPTLSARIVSRRPLRYADGGDARLDRTPHVRAASGVAWARFDGGDRLVVAQDDTSFLALVDPFADPAHVEALALDHVVAGRRVFESRLGNKRDKLDLEACVAIAVDGVEHVLVVGSGSLPVRERMVLVGPGGHAEVVQASALYAALRSEPAFSGSELNVEGAARLGETLLFVQRGNGAPLGGTEPVDAIGAMSLAAVIDHLRGGPAPRLEEVTAYDLGTVRGVRLTFTDASPAGDHLVFLACAEASPDAIEDGEVVGVAIGRVVPGEDARWTLVREADGTPYLGKAEGVAPYRPGSDDGRFWAVVDRDDPDHAADLVEIHLW